MAIQIKRGQSSNWTSAKGTLEPGQLGIEYRDSTNLSPRIKVGKFSSKNNFGECPYLSPDTEIYGEEGHIKQIGDTPVKITSKLSGSSTVDFIFNGYDLIISSDGMSSIGNDNHYLKNIYVGHLKMAENTATLPSSIDVDASGNISISVPGGTCAFKGYYIDYSGDIGSSYNYLKTAYITTINGTTGKFSEVTSNSIEANSIKFMGETVTKDAVSVSGDTLTLSSNILTA